MASAGEIFSALTNATSSEDLKQLATNHLERLLLNSSRNMILILGGCTERIPVSFLFVTPDQTSSCPETLKRIWGNK